MNVLVQQRSADIQEGGHSCPPIKDTGWLENPPSGASDGQGAEKDAGGDLGIAGWKTKTLGDFCDLKNGYAFKSEDYVTDGILNFRVVNINWDGTVNVSNDRKYLPEQFKDSHSQYLLEAGDILFVMVGATRGKLGQIPPHILPALMNQNMWRVVPTNGALDREFLFYFLRHKVPAILGESEDQARGFFKKSDFRDIRLPLPPLHEQKKIAHILSTVQWAIEAQERIIQTTTELKKALMHRIFIEGLRNEPQKQTEIGPVPESWEVVELGQVINLFAGYAFKSKEGVPDSNTQLLRMGNLYQNTLDLNRSPIFYPDSFADTYRRFVLEEGDLVMSLTGTSGKEDYGFTVKIPDTGKKLLLNQRVTRIDIIDDRLKKGFVHPFLLSRKFLDFLYPTAKGMKQANLSTNAMKKLKVVLPLEEEQSEIATCFNSLDQKFVVAGHKSTALHDLFHTLLHELMTAKIRVHNLILGIK